MMDSVLRVQFGPRKGWPGESLAFAADLLRHIVGNPFRKPLPICGRCDGDGKAHGADRPFNWSGPGTYPGPCPACKGRKYEMPWMTPLVLDLVQQLYDGDQDVTPILHDALLDAGAPEELVEHFAVPSKLKTCPTCDGGGELYGCYSADDGVERCDECHGNGEVENDDDGTHPKGCWALDLILGKE